MRIIYKLIIGFMAIAVLVAAVGYISITTNQHVRHSASQLRRSSLAEMNYAEEMMSAIKICHASLNELLSINPEDNPEVSAQDMAEKRLDILTALQRFQLYLTKSRYATELGLRYAQEEKAPQLVDREMKELNLWYNSIQDTFFSYRYSINKMFALFEPSSNGDRVDIKRDLNKATEFFDRRLDALYREALLPQIKEYSEHAQNEFLEGILMIDKQALMANRTIASWAFVSVIIAILIGVFIANSISGPIVKLRDAAKEVGRGNFDYPIKVYTGGEIKELARSFRKMSKELRSTQQQLEERIIERTAELRESNKKLRLEIIDRKHAENALRKSEAQNKAMLDAIPDLMFLVSADGVFLDYRAKNKEDILAPEAQVIGSNIKDLLPDDIAKKTLKNVLKTLQTQKVLFMEFQLPVQGNLYDYEARIMASGEREALIIVRNISDRKEWERALKASETKLATALTIARMGYWDYDIGKDEFTFNDQFYAMLRTTAEEQGGYTMSSADYAQRFVHPEDLSLVGIEIQKAIEATDPDFSSELEHRIIFADGEAGYINVRFFVIHDQNGRTVKTFGVNQDITEYKIAEEALRKSEQDYRGLFEGAHDAIIIFQPKSEIVLDVNRRACEMYGIDRSEFIGLSLEKISKNVPKGKNQIQKTVKTGFFHSFESVQYKMDGSEMYVDINASLVNFRGQQAIQSINRDITEWKKAEEGLKLFRTLIDRSNDIFEVLDPETGRFLDVNEKACIDLGYSRDELLSKTIFDIDPTANINSFKKTADKIRKSGMMLEGMHKRKDGSTYPVELNINEVKLDRNYRVTIARDITERRKAEETLRDREQKLSTIIEHSNELFFIYDTQLMVTYVSPQSKEIFGYKPEEMLVDWTTFLTDNPINDEGFKIAKRTITTGKRQRPFIFEVKRKNKECLIVEIDQSPIKDENGQVVAVSGALRDVTEKKQAEEALRRSERKFKQLFEEIPDAIFLTRMGRKNRGEILDVNRAAVLQTGYEKNELIGMNILKELKDETALKKEILEYESSVSTDITVRFAEKKRRKDGNEYWTEVQLTKIDYGEEPVLMSVNRDITERKNSEAALRESEEKYRTVFENAAIGIYRSTPDGRVIVANPALLGMLGYSSFEELSGRNIEQEGYGERYRRSKFKELIERDNQIKDFEAMWKRRDGSEIFIRENARVIRDSDGNVLYYEGTVENITEQRLAEKELRLQSAALNSAANAIMITDKKGIVQWVNPAFCQLSGYTMEELIGNTPGILKSGIHDDAYYQKLWDSILEGKLWEAEVINKCKSGKLITIEQRIAPVLDEHGEISHFIAIQQDITQRKLMENALREREELYRTLAEAAPVSIYIINKKMRIEYVNKFGARQLLTKPSQITGKKLTEVFPKPIAKEQISILNSIFKSGKPYKGIDKIKFSRIFMWIDSQVIPLRSQEGKIYAVLGISHNITELKKTGDALRQYTARLEALQQIYRGILASKSPEEIAHSALSELKNIVSKFQRSTVVLFNLKGEEATILAHNVLWDSKVKTREHIPISEFQHVYDLQDKPYVLVKDLKKERSKAPVEAQLLKEGVRSYFSLPMKINDRLIGSFNIGADTPDAFSQQEIEIACEVGEQLAVALNQARLQKQIQQHAVKIRASLREKEMLLKEIHHRVKNNMQVISSLLNLQSAKIQDSSYIELFRDSENRIKSMGLIHEKLYQSESLSMINFMDYITELTNSLFSSYAHTSGNVGLNLDIDNTNLGVDTAIPCGLIINELVSNAFKYAFPKNDGGEIAIKLQRLPNTMAGSNGDSHAAERRYELVVRDNGVGLQSKPDLGKIKSLGLKLVYSLVQQLKGTIDYNNNNGAEFRIQFQEIDKSSIKREKKHVRV